MASTTKSLIRTFFVVLGLSMVAAAQQASEADQAMKSQQWEKARALYQRAVNNNASDARAWYGLGMVSMKVSDFPAAISAFEKSAALGVLPLISTYNLACAYARSGDKEKALAALEKVAGAAPRLAISAMEDDDLASVRADLRFSDLEKKAEENASPCKHDAHSREFDFWAGDWDVFNRITDAKVGTSHIEKSVDGCLLIENWQNLFGGTGKSFNTVNPGSGKWQQYWVGSDGEVALYNGELQGGEMRFEGISSSRGAPDAPVHLTFTALPDGSVRQHGESKAKDGTEWVTTYDFIYRKKN